MSGFAGEASGPIVSEDPAKEKINYAIRTTFGVVHGVILTVISLALAMWFPSLSHFLFGLFGFVVAPLCSLALTFICNACVSYVSSFRLEIQKSLRTAWIPPLGILIVALVLLPLEMMPSLGLPGPLNILAASFVASNCILVTLLQIYASKGLQSSFSESLEGGSVPK